MNKISFVLATYQADIPMLHKALECSDLFDEVILHVNDKLTAGMVTIPRNCRVLYQEERCSVQDALNVSINLATGKYILPFTDDDYFDRESLISALKSLETYDDIVYYPVYVGNDISGWKKWAEPQVTYEKLLNGNLIPFSSVYNKKVWEQVGGYKSVPFSDWFFWLEALKIGYKLRYFDTPVYYHRNGHKITLAIQESQQYNPEQIKEIFQKRLGVING